MGMYVGVHLVGLLGGFYDARRWDKKETLDCFQE
jgi:hypothetical protein